MKLLGFVLSATIVSVSLAGCTSVANGCPISGRDLTQLTMQIESDLNQSKKMIPSTPSLVSLSTENVKTILVNPRCFDSDEIYFVEQASGRVANWNYTPETKSEPRSIYAESVRAIPEPLTEDIAQLQKSLDSLKFTKTTYGYSFSPREYGFLWSLISDQSLNSPLENSEANRTQNFTYFQATAHLFVGLDDDSTKPSFSNSFEFSEQYGSEATCNGIRFDSAGESYFFAGYQECGWAKLMNKWHAYDPYELFQDPGFNETDWLRFLLVMGQNPFTVNLIDQKNVRHSFQSKNGVEKETNASRVILTLLEAKKALELGLWPRKLPTKE